MPGDKAAVRSRADITVSFDQLDDNGVCQLVNAPKPLVSDPSPTNCPISTLATGRGLMLFSQFPAPYCNFDCHARSRPSPSVYGFNPESQTENDWTEGIP
jgi:hypothetical protein